MMQQSRQQYITSITIIGILFFIFGFVTWLNGPLITYAKYAFNLKTDRDAFWITFAFYISYFALALPSSAILERTGMKKGMALGLVIMAAGTFMFGQFATTRNYSLALFGLFIIGSGMTLMQTASNPYISILGPLESAAQRISIMGIANKFAGILSPIIIGAFVLTGIDKFEDEVKAVSPNLIEGFSNTAGAVSSPNQLLSADSLIVKSERQLKLFSESISAEDKTSIVKSLNILKQEQLSGRSTVSEASTNLLQTWSSAREGLLNRFASKIYLPYMIMALALILLAVWVMRSSLPEINAAEFNAQPEGTALKNKESIFQFPHLWLGAICIFTYVGVEVLAGDAIGTYGNDLHLPKEETKYFTSFTLGFMLVGYLMGLLLIPKFISQQLALRISAIFGLVCSVLAFATEGYFSVWMVASLGFANALMWPAIFPLGISGLGKFTERGAAILIMGIAGGALLPLAFGALKEVINFQLAFMLLALPCYLYILYFALKGHKAGRGSAL